MEWTTITILWALLTTFAEATLAGEPCVDVTGAPASEWQRCQGSCCSARCSCINVDGEPQADCQVICAGIALRPGCRLLEPFQNSTHMDCCRTECTEQTCQSSSGRHFGEGERWTECNLDQGCCWRNCQCVRAGNHLLGVCEQECLSAQLPRGCFIAQSVETDGVQRCCNIRCPFLQHGFPDLLSQDSQISKARIPRSLKPGFPDGSAMMVQ
ncbi:uncharacterized protein LOC135481283 [Liolophura sinensis]|uniref:uncharacterized protein LOC135481283 n=1 Tax=Liolophura sinensis TaxID=3198878 RepID=UPI003158739E